MTRVCNLLLIVALVFCIPGITHSQWHPSTLPPLNVFSILTQEISFTQSYVFVGADSGVYMSSNGGSTWFHPANSGMQPREVVYGLVTKDSFLFAATSSHGVFRSTDLAASWQPVNNGLLSGGKYTFALGDSGIFLGTARGVYFSSDDGSTWQARNAAMINTQVWELEVAPATPEGQILYAGVALLNGGVYRSTDNGLSWEKVSIGWTNSSIWALAAGVESSVFAGTETDGVYYSSDGGSTWEHRGLLSRSVQELVVVPTHGGGQDVFAATYGAGVFSTADNGMNWLDANAGLTGRNGNALACNSMHLFVGLSPGGAWRRKLSEIVPVEDDHSSTPAAFVLHQNYPNPFNSSTEILFELATRSHILLEVLDPLGRVITEYEPDHELAAGLHRWSFAAPNLASGVYLYRISGDGFVATREMVLVK
jgi:hypothetical protein